LHDVTSREEIETKLRELDEGLERSPAAMRLSVYFHLTHWVHSSDLGMADYVYAQRRITSIADKHGVDRRPVSLPPDL
jgi:DNA recombination-dependent growth factor C